MGNAAGFGLRIPDQHGVGACFVVPGEHRFRSLVDFGLQQGQGGLEIGRSVMGPLAMDELFLRKPLGLGRVVSHPETSAKPIWRS